jgi:hypothetical protein
MTLTPSTSRRLPPAARGPVVVFVLLLAALVSGAGAASGQDAADASAARAPLGVTASADLLSTYMWRGIRMSKGWVVQPSLTIESHGVSLNLWGNVDLSTFPGGSEHTPSRFTEADLTAGYGRSVGKATVTGGVVHYHMHEAANATELFASVSVDAPLSPAVAGYYDVDDGGGFVSLSVGHELVLRRGVRLRLGVSVFDNLGSELLGVDEDGRTINGIYGADATASFSVPLTPSLVVSPRIAYSTGLGAKGRAGLRSVSIDGATPSRVYAGLSVVRTF